jgi:hypothetical protein
MSAWRLRPSLTSLRISRARPSLRSVDRTFVHSSMVYLSSARSKVDFFDTPIEISARAFALIGQMRRC